MQTSSLMLGLPKRGHVPKELCAVACSRYFLSADCPGLCPAGIPVQGLGAGGKWQRYEETKSLTFVCVLRLFLCAYVYIGAWCSCSVFT